MTVAVMMIGNDDYKGRDHKHMCELQHDQPLKSVPIIRITIIFTSSVNYSLSLGLHQGRGALATKHITIDTAIQKRRNPRRTHSPREQNIRYYYFATYFRAYLLIHAFHSPCLCGLILLLLLMVGRGLPAESGAEIAV